MAKCFHAMIPLIWHQIRVCLSMHVYVCVFVLCVFISAKSEK